MSGPTLDLGMLLGGGVALLRRRPGAVLVWTLIYVAGVAGADLMARQILLANPSGDGGGFSLLLIELLLALISPLLLTAAMRALVRPRETEFASLDAGMDELRVIGIFLILSIFFAIISWISTLVFGGIALATLSSVVAIIALLFPLLAAACLFARLSLAFPLALIRKRISLEEAWGLSEGHFWPFFLAYAIIALGMILVGLAISAAMDWSSFAALLAGQGVGVRQLRVMTPVDALTILRWVLNGAQATLGVVFVAGAMIAAARVLVPDKEELAKTFS
jgi:hypothetical protein